jgi:hypothetical protein
VPTSIYKIAAAASLAAAVVFGVARWPSVKQADPAYRAWHVQFSSGDALMVPMERDTLTTESVLKSRQVRAMLGRVERRHLLIVLAVAGLLFVGIIVLCRMPVLRRRITPGRERV